MKENKRLVESAIILGLASALSITAVVSNDTADSKSTKDATTLANAEIESNEVTAGVAEVLSAYKLSAADKADLLVSVESEKIDVLVTAANAESEDQIVLVSGEEDLVTDGLTAEELEWQNYLMADVDEYVNVRSEASADASLAGKLYKGDKATVEETGSEWTLISSGNLKGYVKNEYCLFGADALVYAKENCDTVAKATTGGVRVRKEMNTDSAIVTALGEGDTIKVDTKAETEEGWVAVKYDGDTCYISADLVEVSIKTGTGKTVEEEKAEEAAKKAATKSSSGTKQTESVDAEVDDVTLLAAIIYCEAGGEGYDTQLAVGAVVCNRVKSKSYPNSISKVIYQRGQFGPASSGKLARVLKNGVSKTSKKAAQAAIDGSDNTDGAKSFRDASSGHKGTLIGTMVFF